MTSAGRYRHDVTIQRLKTAAELTPDDGGHIDQNASASWTKYESRRCAIKDVGGREVKIAGQVFADCSHIVEMRFDPKTRAITPDMRLKWVDCGTTRILNIASVTDGPESGRRRSVMIACNEEK